MAAASPLNEARERETQHELEQNILWLNAVLKAIRPSVVNHGADFTFRSDEEQNFHPVVQPSLSWALDHSRPSVSAPPPSTEKIRFRAQQNSPVSRQAAKPDISAPDALEENFIWVSKQLCYLTCSPEGQKQSTLQRKSRQSIQSLLLTPSIMAGFEKDATALQNLGAHLDGRCERIPSSAYLAYLELYPTGCFFIYRNKNSQLDTLCQLSFEKDKGFRVHHPTDVDDVGTEYTPSDTKQLGKLTDVRSLAYQR